MRKRELTVGELAHMAEQELNKLLAFLRLVQQTAKRSMTVGRH